jgi:hypothetical protein
MPSMALKAMRRNIQAGMSAKAASEGAAKKSQSPSATETTHAASVTWLAVTPIACRRTTSGRSRAWKRGFNS